MRQILQLLTSLAENEAIDGFFFVNRKWSLKAGGRLREDRGGRRTPYRLRPKGVPFLSLRYTKGWGKLPI